MGPIQYLLYRNNFGVTKFSKKANLNLMLYRLNSEGANFSSNEWDVLGLHKQEYPYDSRYYFNCGVAMEINQSRYNYMVKLFGLWGEKQHKQNLNKNKLNRIDRLWFDIGPDHFRSFLRKYYNY